MMICGKVFMLKKAFDLKVVSAYQKGKGEESWEKTKELIKNQVQSLLKNSLKNLAIQCQCTIANYTQAIRI